MTESKIELTERLRREGRWAEASKLKDTAMQEFRGKGMKRDEASDAAWEAMATAFPPLPPAEESISEVPNMATGNPHGYGGHDEDLIALDALLKRIGDQQSPDLIRDSLWVYQHLANRNAKPENAPSLGAWSLLQWARQYKNRFFEQVLPRAMLNKPDEEKKEQVRREKSKIEDIKALLEELNQQSAEELAANVPESIKAKVRGILEDWERRSALTIPNEANADLQAHIARLVQDSVEAISHHSGGN
jgi:hypothetical protein